MTNCYVIALGAVGVRLAEAAVYGCMAGTIRAEALHVVTIGADADRLQALAADYAAVRGGVGSVDGAFAAAVDVCVEEVAPTAPQMEAKTETDRLLLRALFTRDEAGRDAAADMGGCGPVAALNWASRLRAEGMHGLAALGAGDTVVLMGSLCDAACAAGVTPLRAWIAQKQPVADVCGVFLLPVKAQDDAGLCREALRQMKETDWRALCLLGMPEDCRDAREEAAHLTDWMAAYALDGVLGGTVGGHTVRLMADRLDWADFGAEAARYQASWDGMARAAWLVLAEYGATAVEKLVSPNWLRDRMGWYGAYFAQVRRMTQEQREAQAALMRSAMRLMGGYARWLREVCEELPASMQWTEQLETARGEAEEHYKQIIELAGRLALLEHDAEAGDMANERFVHRHDMSDSAAEATMRRIGEMKEELAALAQAQEALNKRIGGRAQRNMLEGFVRTCGAEAGEMRGQAEEARRRIDRAASVASPEEMDRVELARSKLARLERHLSVLDGRTARAKLDWELAGVDEIRTRAPEMGGEQTARTKPLYNLEGLGLMAAIPDAEAKEQRKMAAKLGQSWMWADAPKAAMDAISRGGAESDMPAALLLRRIIEQMRGGDGHAEGMDRRTGAFAG